MTDQIIPIAPAPGSRQNLTAATHRLGKWVGALLLLLVAVGAILRYSGVRSELWFDEIFSIRQVEPMTNAWQVLWSRHHDNKHYLIWLWLWLWGPGRAEWIYRLPALGAGIAVLPLLFALVRRELSTRAAWLALLLAVYCYPLIHYSSEARGYSLAVLLAVCAYLLAPRTDAERPRGSPLRAVVRPLLFGLCVLLGFLAHLTFVYVYAGLLAWSAVEFIRRPDWRLALYHAPVIVMLALIYVFDVSKMEYGGGPPTPVFDVIRWTISLTFGVPLANGWTIAMGTVAVGLMVLGWSTMVRRRGDVGVGVFFIDALLLVPLVLTLRRHNPYLAVRYFLVCAPFALLLVAGGMDRIWSHWIGQILTIALITMVAFSGVSRAWQLYLLGRGEVRGCLLHIAASGGTSATIRYESERPTMDRANVEYYAQRLGLGDRVVEVDDAASDSGQVAEWWILDLDDPMERGPQYITRRGHLYRLDSIYPGDGVSGLTWDLYHWVTP